MPQLSSLLVVPTGACSPATGAGQRTHLIYGALRQLGPVHVAVLQPDDQEDENRHFQDCASYSVIRNSTILLPRDAGRAGILWQRVQRLLVPERLMRACAKSQAAFRAIVETNAIDVVVFRYAKALCPVEPGAGQRLGRGMFLDWDDRDDLQYLSLVEARGGGFLARSVIAKRAATALRRRIAEASGCLDRIWLTDARALSVPRDAREAIVPNTVMRSISDGAMRPPSDGAYLLFVGTIWYRPNAEGVTWFLTKVWPLISAANPRIRIRFLGGGNWQEIKKLCGDDPRVDVMGFVDDLDEQYMGARGAIAPILSGGGTQIKVLEACLYGRPVVVSRFSAEGYDGDLKKDMLVAETPEDFAAACLKLFDDPENANLRGQSLRREFLRSLGAEAISDRIRRDILEVVGTAEEARGMEEAG